MSRNGIFIAADGYSVLIKRAHYPLIGVFTFDVHASVVVLNEFIQIFGSINNRNARRFVLITYKRIIVHGFYLLFVGYDLQIFHLRHTLVSIQEHFGIRKLRKSSSVNNFAVNKHYHAAADYYYAHVYTLFFVI